MCRPRAFASRYNDPKGAVGSGVGDLWSMRQLASPRGAISTAYAAPWCHTRGSDVDHSTCPRSEPLCDLKSFKDILVSGRSLGFH